MSLIFDALSAPQINISPVPDIVSASRHFVPVTRTPCRSTVYDILLKFENESCRSHMKSCRTVTDDRRLFHALPFISCPDSDSFRAIYSFALKVSFLQSSPANSTTRRVDTRKSRHKYFGLPRRSFQCKFILLVWHFGFDTCLTRHKFHSFLIKTRHFEDIYVYGAIQKLRNAQRVRVSTIILHIVT